MFPRLRQQLLARADLLMELATLGEYGVDERGAVMEIRQDAAVLCSGTRRRGCDSERVASPFCAKAPDRVLPARP